MNDHQEQVSVGAVARRLDISSERARQLLDEGRLGPVQRGAFGYRFVSREKLEEFARQRERGKRARTGSRYARS